MADQQAKEGVVWHKLGYFIFSCITVLYIVYVYPGWLLLLLLFSGFGLRFGSCPLWLSSIFFLYHLALFINESYHSINKQIITTTCKLSFYFILIMCSLAQLHLIHQPHMKLHSIFTWKNLKNKKIICTNTDEICRYCCPLKDTEHQISPKKGKNQQIKLPCKGQLEEQMQNPILVLPKPIISSI